MPGGSFLMAVCKENDWPWREEWLAMKRRVIGEESSVVLERRVTGEESCVVLWSRVTGFGRVLGVWLIGSCAMLPRLNDWFLGYPSVGLAAAYIKPFVSVCYSETCNDSLLSLILSGEMLSAETLKPCYHSYSAPTERAGFAMRAAGTNPRKEWTRIQ